MPKLVWARRTALRALQGFMVCFGGIALLGAVFWLAGLSPASGWQTMALSAVLISCWYAFAAAYGARPGRSVWTSPLDRLWGERASGVAEDSAKAPDQSH